MMRIELLALGLGLGLGLAACATDGDGAGSGEDILPKRGELATDPTIVSATARCWSGEISVPGGPEQPLYIGITVAGSDPMGAENMGTCAGSLGGGTADQDTFSSSGNCYLDLRTACTPGSNITVGLTVSNKTGGVTTASIRLTIAPE
jgi:hypothetical protein